MGGGGGVGWGGGGVGWGGGGGWGVGGVGGGGGGGGGGQSDSFRGSRGHTLDEEPVMMAVGYNAGEPQKLGIAQTVRCV